MLQETQTLKSQDLGYGIQHAEVKNPWALGSHYNSNPARNCQVSFDATRPLQPHHWPALSWAAAGLVPAAALLHPEGFWSRSEVYTAADKA